MPASKPSPPPPLPPLPPERPEPGDCCNSGCERCVYVVYEEQLEAYREALRLWKEAQPGPTA